MAIAKVGATGVAFVATTASMNTVTGGYGQSPTAGNLLVMGVTISTPLATATSCTTPSGWTAGPAGAATVGPTSYKAAIYTFWKIAAGSDLNPQMNVTGGTYSTGIAIEQWSGLATTSPVDAVSTVGTKNDAASFDSGTLTPGPITTTNPTDLIWTFAGLMQSGDKGTGVWGGGSAVSSHQWPGAYVAVETASRVTSVAGTFTPTFTWLAGDGTVSTYGGSIVSIAFRSLGAAPAVTPVNTTRGILFDVKARVSTNRISLWNVLQTLVPVSTTRAISADVAVSVAAQRAISADVAVSIVTQRAVSADIAVSIVTQRAVSADIAEQIAIQREISHDVAEQVAVQRGISHDIAEQVSTTREVTHRTLVSVFIDRIAQWRVLSFLTGPPAYRDPLLTLNIPAPALILEASSGLDFPLPDSRLELL